MTGVRVVVFGVLALIGVLGAVVGWWVLVGIAVVLLLLAVYDVVQRRHAVLRNYPVVGHLRYLLERIRPEVQQYFIERNFDGRPYDRDTRSIIYERAKGIQGEKAFGTERDVNEVGYEYLVHAAVPVLPAADPPRVSIGGPDCTQPYDMALLNVSAMSFGALSANALRALNIGAANGGFAHDTGEGGLSKHHLYGGDLVWELGSGYFGARTADGDFDPDQFADKAAYTAVKCVSLKLSQGAKPGIGGVLPAAKVTAEIAAVRGSRSGRSASAPRRTRRSARHASWCSSSRGCGSWRAASRSGSSCASGRGWTCSRSARRCWPRARARTSSSSTARRAARARPRWNTRTTSAHRSPKAC